MEVVIGVVSKWEDIFVVERKKKDGILKSFPSWEVEINESKENAVEREVIEETWVTAKIVKLLGNRVHPKSKKNLTYYAMDYVSGEISNIDKWISKVYLVSKMN